MQKYLTPKKEKNDVMATKLYSLHGDMGDHIFALWTLCGLAVPYVSKGKSSYYEESLLEKMLLRVILIIVGPLALCLIVLTRSLSVPEDKVRKEELKTLNQPA